MHYCNEVRKKEDQQQFLFIKFTLEFFFQMEGDDDSSTRAIVIDGGSKFIKSGFGGEDQPKTILNLASNENNLFVKR